MFYLLISNQCLQSRKRGRSNDNGDLPCPKQLCNKGDSGYPGMAVSWYAFMRYMHYDTIYSTAHV